MCVCNETTVGEANKTSISTKVWLIQFHTVINSLVSPCFLQAFIRTTPGKVVRTQIETFVRLEKQ